MTDDRQPKAPVMPADAIETVMLTSAQIRERVAELARTIDHDYEGRDPLLIFVMKGALLFVADLMRELRGNFRLDFMIVSSYGSGTETSGSVRIVADLKSDIHGQDVLVVEDIVDSGLTLTALLDYLRLHSPASIEICTLLSKPSRRRVEVDCRYVGFEIEDRFVVGYGLDFDERYRGLPDIAVLKTPLTAGME
jgi:hypoxanthine phosphoribosyltransferase